jgi:hypothetical protein
MASVTVTFTHPQFNRTETLNISDAKMEELSKGNAIERFAESMIRSVRETYRRLKAQQDIAAVPPPAEIDA